MLNAGLKRKIWAKLSAIRPHELKKVIQKSTKDAVPVVGEGMLNKLQAHQRRLWSSHMKHQRLEKTAMQRKSLEVKRKESLHKKTIRAQKLREYEASKRKRAKEACRGLVKVLVPTNIPDKHGYDPTVSQVYNA